MSYWLVALALVAFGVVGALSIGAPFLLVGAAMVVLGPFRRRRVIFVPAMLGVIGLVITTSVLVPFSCTATSTTTGDALTVCTSLAGLTLVRAGPLQPAARGVRGRDADRPRGRRNDCDPFRCLDVARTADASIIVG